MSAVRGNTGHACELFNEPKGLNNHYLARNCCSPDWCDQDERICKLFPKTCARHQTKGL